MTIFPIFTSVCVFGVIFTVARIRVSKKDEANQRAFWDREDEANAVRAKDISNLPYIQIPLDYLPIGISNDPTLKECEEKIRLLSDKKILNLSGYSNTDLKLMYGAGNINILSECDDNFAELSQLIIKWAKALDDLGFEDEAISVLEYGIGWGSDISANFTMLGELYCRTGEFSRVDELIETAKSLNSPSKDIIINALNAL
ncbi:MAG: hypothetical protein K6G40_08045 [Eubacterium sp.]|nr:hypothetical protein [Eubacterium sp.]